MPAPTQQIFAGLAFPVVRVRYCGPTETRGARWKATLRREERTYRATVGYDDALPTGAQQAIHAAWECWRAFRYDMGEDGSHADYLAIPGDLDADAYSFTIVPARFFAGGEA